MFSYVLSEISYNQLENRTLNFARVLHVASSLFPHYGIVEIYVHAGPRGCGGVHVHLKLRRAAHWNIGLLHFLVIIGTIKLHL